MSLAPLTRMYKWEPVADAKLCSEVKRELRFKKLRAYRNTLVILSICIQRSNFTDNFAGYDTNNRHIWTARRPSAT